MTPQSYKDDAKLYIYTPSTDNWHTIDTFVCWFALVCYDSKLVLVGGVEYVSELGEGQCSDKLLTLNDDEEWQEDLPCMNTKRHSASAASHKDHLLVAGGATVDPLNVVEVLMPGGSCWIFVKSLLYPCQNMKSVVFNGCWYLSGGQDVLYASLDSLIAGTSCEWEKLPSTVPDSHRTLAAFGNRLIVIENQGVSSPLREDIPFKEESTSHVDKTTSASVESISSPYSSAILAYSPLAWCMADSGYEANFPQVKLWVYVGDIPSIGESSTYTAVASTSNEELIVVGSSVHFVVDLNGM